MRAFLGILFFVVLALPAEATKNRGVWFWSNTGSPWGSDAIVGVSAQEDQTITFLTGKGVRKVYGSYGSRPVTQASVIAAWNAKLNVAGMESQCLLSENTWIFVANRPALLTLITQRVVNFNSAPGRTLAEKFDGIHLDIEPQGLPGWSSLTAAQKRDYLIDLRDTFAEVRNHLTTSGLPNFPVYADLPVWFDNLPANGGSVGWLNAADRDQWFADVATSLTGVTLMPFQRTTFSSIDSGVSWERANMTGAVVRVGLEAYIGTGLTWPTVPDFDTMLNALESAYGPNGAVDIQSYRQWREAIAAQPVIAVAALIQPALLATEADIVYQGEAGWTHVVLYSPDLCNWQIVQRVNAANSAPITLRVQLTGQRGFWRVDKFQESN